MGFDRYCHAQAYNWQTVPIMGGGFVPGLAYSPIQQNLFYVRTDVGGFYRWDNTNSRWIPLTDMYRGNNFGGESIAPDPVNANVVYAAAGFSGPGTILRSTDQGDSWTANPIPVSIAGNNDGREAGERLAVDPNLNTKLYFGSRWQGLWVSTNSASSWSQVGSFPVSGDAGYGIAWVIFPPPGGGYGHPSGSASATIYAGVMAMGSGNSNLYRSTNAGANWSLVPGGPSGMITPHASLGTDGNLWIVYDGGGYGPNGVTSGQVWKLNTSTLAWSNVTPSGGPCNGCGGYAGISVDAQNANHAIISTLDWWWPGDEVLSTVNGGGSWVTIAMANSGNSVFNNNGAIYQNGCSGVPGGAGWAGFVAIDPFNSNNAFYPSGEGGGVWSSTNIQSSPVTWTYRDNNLEETVPIYMNPAAVGGILFSCMGDVGGMRHANLTQSPASGMYCNPQYTNTNMLDFAESRPNTVVRAGNSTNPSSVNSDVAYSTNNGQTWTPWGSAPPGYGTSGQMGCVAVAADGSRIVVAPYGGNGSPAYASSLGGGWTTCTGLPSGAMVASDRSNPSTFYATYPAQWVFGGTVTVYVSTNGGTSFSQVNTIPVNWGDANGNGQWVMPRPVFGQPGEFWVSTYNALYRFTNAGSNVTTIPNVYEPMGPVGFGKAAPSQTHPAVFLVGTVNGTYGFFRNDDGAGVTWTRINDDTHQYNGPNWIEGDESIYGRCYLGAGGRGILYGDVVAVTPTATPTSTPTRTPTRTPTSTLTNSPTQTATSSATKTATLTPTASTTPTPSASPTQTPTRTASATATSSMTPSATASSTPTLSFTPSWTPSLTASPTASPTHTPTRTLTSSPTSSPTYTPSFTATQTASFTTSSTPGNSATSTFSFTVSSTTTSTMTSSPTNTPASTATSTPPLTVSATPTNTLVNSATPTSSPTVSSTGTPTTTSSPTSTLANTATRTASTTPTSSASATASSTDSATATSSPALTATPSASPTKTFTATASMTPSATASSTSSSSPSSTPTLSFTPSWTPSLTASLSPTLTATPSASPTATGTATPSSTPSMTPTRTFTTTTSATATSSMTPTRTVTPTNTATATASLTASPSASPSPTPTGTPAPNGNQGVVLYPNPSTGPTVNLLPPSYPGVSDVEVRIFTTSFRKVLERTFLNIPSGATLSLSVADERGVPLANGLYYVVVRTKSGLAIGKLLVLH
ncbi:MAG TPA: hypothetical protein VHE12_08870 [bacterium]|nr:hypothetical protein [bacterium]